MTVKMDSVGKVTSNFSLEALKEPRGFIRVLEFILAIFAFATICSFNTNVKFSVATNENTTAHEYSIHLSYPFSLRSVSQPIKEITPKDPKKPVAVTFGYGPKGPAEFFVFVGVMAMLYTIGAFVLYVFFDDLYRRNNRLIIADFVVTALWSFLWLISSSVWAQGVTDLKFYSNPTDSLCPQVLKHPQAVCKPGSSGTFAAAAVSVIFGFLNMVVWVGNGWFLWKETPWFKKSQEDYIPDPASPGPPTESTPPPLY